MATEWISPTWRMPNDKNQSKFENYSLDTSGTSEGINVGSMADLFGTASVTYNTSYSIWVKPEFNYNDATYQTFFGNFTSGNEGALLYYHAGDDRWRFLVGNGSGYDHIQSDSIISNEALGKGEWQHHCVVFDTVNNNAYYYINNQQINTSTGLNKKIDTNCDFLIGKKWDYTTAAWTGEITQACVFNYALSTGQRNYLYNSGTPINPMAIPGQSPLAYWPLGGSSTGSASTLTVPNESVPDATVFDFDGSSDSISCDFTNTSNTGSISVWVSPTDYSTGQQVVWCFNGSGYRDYIGLFQTSSGVISFETADNGANKWRVATTSSAVTNSVWTHLLCTFDGSNAIIYVNGVEVPQSYTHTSDITYWWNDLTPTNYRLGILQVSGYSTGQFYNGKINNTQLWSSKLEASDVTTLYNNGVPLLSGTQPQAANLRSWYPMNVENANWEADTSGDWQIADAVSSYPQSFDFGEANTGSEYITTTYFPNGETNFTFSTWLNCNFYQKGTPIAAYGGSTHQNFMLTFWTGGGGTMYLYIGSGNYGQLNNVNSYVSTDWVNFSFVYDGSFTDSDTATQNAGRIKLYINGTYQTFDSFNGTIPSIIPSGNTGFYLGTSTPTTYEYGGKMSNVMLFNSSLLATGTDSVETLYNNGVPLLTASVQSSNLKAWYKLDNTATFSTNWSIPDASGNGNTGTSSGMTESNLVNNNVSTLNGTSSGMTTANLVNSDLTRSIPYSSYSLNFDGGDWATPSISLNTLSASTAFSVSCWVKIDTNTNYDHLVGAPTAYSAWDTGFGIYLTGSAIRFWVEQWNGSNQYVETAALSTDQWYHITATFDTTNALKLYVDGSTVTTASGTTIDGLTNTIYLGSTGANATYALNGNLNNVAIWNSELTQDQILSIYNGGVPNDISSLSPSAWWSLAGDSYYDGTNFILPDLSASSNNATTANMSGIELVGNGPGSSANGTATNMDIPTNLEGNAPNSSSNAFSVNMDTADRVASVPS